MKVLMLIISSDTDPVYEQHRSIWSSYMNLNPQIDAYFFQYRNGPEELNGNMLWLTGHESFQTIISKTIDSIQYFLGRNTYDFIIRTNLSSVWNFDILLKYLETLPKENVYAGYPGTEKGVKFVSGAGYIMTPDVCKILIKDRQIAECYPHLDDVAVGYVMMKNNIPILSGSRNDTLKYNSVSYHYRIKMPDRNLDKDIMIRLVNSILANID
jgi:hypothetical protein